MSYTALYRKWRPQVFEDVIGQSHITQTIKNQIKSKKSSHAYLFCGTRGTGKTSTAKIFSKAINCLDSQDGNPCNQCDICKGIDNGTIMDVIEIDAASNNGVDNIREIREEVVYTPSRGNFKVYIIDEVHMLSTGAFNALLKTLEEPPSHVTFILATTESHKIPATILSRCQRYDFKRITAKDIFSRIQYVLKEEKIDVEQKVLKVISKVAYGSMRDALSILDQCIAYSGNNITYESIKDTLGLADTSIYYDIIWDIIKQDIASVINYVEELYVNGKDINIFVNDIINAYRDILLYKSIKNPEVILDIDEEDLSKFKNISSEISEEKIISSIEILSEAQQNIKWSDNSRIILEITMIKLCNSKYSESKEDLIGRLSEIERKIETGTFNTKQIITEKKEVIIDNVVMDKKEELLENNSEKENKIEMNQAKETIENKGPSNDKIISMWPEILKEIKFKNQLQLHGNLNNVKVIDTNNCIGIVFGNSLSIIKMLVEKSIDIIKNAIKEVSGVEVEVKCFLEKELKEENKNYNDTSNNCKDINNNYDKLKDLEEMAEKWPGTINIYDK